MRNGGFGRRAFLERSALTAAGLSLPWIAPGCSSPAEARRAPPPLSVDPNRPWWLQGNFAPVQDEIDVTELSVSGSIPPELDGLYVRNGSNPKSGDSAHWFFGDGMVHGVRIQNGRALWYRNRWVKTALLGSDTSAPPGGASNASNVSVFQHAGRLLSSGEVGHPYALDAADLATLGVHDFDGALATAFTAHPKVDPSTGHLHGFGYGFLPPYLTYHVVDQAGLLVKSEEIAVAQSTMMHSFAITDQDVVFWELPVLFDLEAAISGASVPYKWDPAYGARIGVLPLGGSGADVRWVEIEPCYVFHEVNAFRDGDDVVVDVCRHPSMFEDGDLSRSRSAIHRWRIGTAGEALTVSDERIADLSFELPTHDRRYTGRRNRYGWFVTTREQPDTLDLAGTGRIDFETGESSVWDPGSTRHADEAFFVPAGTSTGEGEGWLLAFVYDHASDASVLAVLDASAVAKGPVAEIRMPRRVPHGFHGVWVPA